MKNRIQKITQLTQHFFLNMFNLNVLDKNGKEHLYHIASRAKKPEELKLVTGVNKPDGVIIYALYGDAQDQVVLIRQFRYSIGTYIYEFPAGLVDEKEDFHAAGIRELKEETGLDFHPLEVNAIYEKPYFTTVGMTDESCAAVYGTATGTISKADLEENEEIDVILADRAEVLRILKEEHVSLMCAYMLMHFLNTKPGNAFEFLNIKDEQK